MKILISILILLFSIPCNAKVDDLLLELSYIKRHLTLTSEQEILWKSAILKTSEMPKYTSGTRAAFRKSLEEIIESPNIDIGDIQQKIVVDHFALVERAVEHHIILGVEWAKFDQSLDNEQRKIFRSKLKDPLIFIYKKMSGRSERALPTEDLSSSSYAHKLNYSPQQLLKIKELTVKEDQLRSALKESNITALSIVETSLNGTELPFSTIIVAMKVSSDSQRSIITQVISNSKEIYETLNDSQRKELAIMAKKKFKFILMLLPKD